MKNITTDDIKELKSNLEWMSDYRKGIALLLLSWGWDIENKKPVEKPNKNQQWQSYPIRFYKAAKSAYLFGEETYFNSMKLYAEYLLSKSSDSLLGEDGFRVKKIFNLPGTELHEMPPPRYL